MRFLILFIALFSVACTDSNIRPISNAEASGNTNTQPQSVIAHTTENQTPKPANTAKWTPGGEAIDTKELDAAIMKAEKDAAGRGADPTAKKALGEAFFRRAMALTEARQYSAAIGDYRRAFKHDPANTDAKVWIDKITTIYASLGKEPPKEGEEPPALPFTVDAQ